jgi:hypothetical protein
VGKSEKQQAADNWHNASHDAPQHDDANEPRQKRDEHQKRLDQQFTQFAHSPPIVLLIETDDNEIALGAAQK